VRPPLAGSRGIRWPGRYQ